MTVDERSLAALRARFRNGDTPPPARKKPAAINVTLHVIALGMVPLGGELRIATDGALHPDYHYGAAAAVASTGHILVGWYDEPGLPFGFSSYAELQGIRLAYRLAPAVGPKPVIICDYPDVVTAIKNARFRRSAFGCTDRALFGEVTRHARSGRAVLEARPHRHGETSAAAAGPLEGVAHRLAWTTVRLLVDGISPAGEWDYLSDVASLRGRNRTIIARSYSRWRTGGAGRPARRFGYTGSPVH